MPPRKRQSSRPGGLHLSPSPNRNRKRGERGPDAFGTDRSTKWHAPVLDTDTQEARFPLKSLMPSKSNQHKDVKKIKQSLAGENIVVEEVSLQATSSQLVYRYWPPPCAYA